MKFNFCLKQRMANLLLLVLFIMLPNMAKASMPADTKVSIDFKSVSVTTVLDAIQKQSGLDFIYTADLAKLWPKVTIRASKKPAKDVIEQVTSLIGCTYSIKGNIVTIHQTVLSGRERKVQGYVRDESGEPLVGVPVCIGESRVCTVTDSEGYYTFSIPVEPIRLKFSYVGMETVYQQIPQGNNDITRNVVMRSDNTLDDVVVTGYSNLRRSDYVGAHQTIKADEIQRGGITSLDQMLQGVVPGMTVMQTTGQVGGGTKIRVRGTSTLLGNQEPLWVVDGVIQRDVVANYNNENYFNYAGDDTDMRQIAANAIAWLNPNDVESITILKDASATAIYGSAAANGVIVVTTKKAPAGGQVSVNYTGELTVGFRPSYGLYDRMNSQQNMTFNRENIAAGMKYESLPLRQGYYGILADFYDKYITADEFQRKYNEMEMANTDWYDLLFRDAISNNHAVSISGGTERITSRASVGYTKTNGEARGNDLKQFTASSNTTIRFNHGIIANALLKGSSRTTDGFAYGVDPFSYAYNTARIFPAYNEDGTYFFLGKQGRTSYATQRDEYNYNILNELEQTGNENRTKTFGAAFDLNIPLLRNLRFKGFASYDYASTTLKSWASDQSYYISSIRGYEYGQFAVNSEQEGKSPLPYGGVLHLEDTNTDNLTFRGDLIYDNLFKNLHRVTLQYGMEIRSAKIRGNYSTTYGYMPQRGETFAAVPKTFIWGSTATDNSLYDDMRNANQIINRENNYLSGYFLGVYNYDDRYVLNISGRIDASNRFGQDKNKKYQPTWAVGAKWRVANEQFMKESTWMNMLDLSASYGYQGNAVEEVSPYLIARTATYDNYLKQYTSSIKSLPYDNLGWEKTNTLNLRVEGAMFDNRLNFDFNYYNKRSDVLSHHDVPYENGQGTSVIGGVKMRNTGYEFIVNFIPVRTKDWTWQVSVNAGSAKNTMERSTIINTLTDYLSGQAVVNKEAYSSLYSYKFIGLDPEDGTPLFDLGKNDDGTDFDGRTQVITTDNPLDYLVKTGKMQPDFNGGFSTSLRYREWTLNAQFSMLLGGSGRIPTLYDYSSHNGIPYPLQNISTRTLERWLSSGDEATTNIPSVPGLGRTVQYVPSDYNIHNPYELYYYSDVNAAKTDMIRCNQLSLTYELPNQLMKRIGAHRMMLRLSLTNPFFIAFDDKWKGIDPETANWPVRRMFSFGANVTF